MPRPRFHKLPQEKQQRILDVALRHFAQHGLEQASYNQIIDACGISKGAMYYYFDDKVDLYVTLAERFLDEKFSVLEQSQQRVASAADFWAVVRDVSYDLFLYAEQRPEWLALGRDFGRLTLAQLGARGAQLWGNALERTSAWLLGGQRVGAVRQDLPLPLLVQLVAALDGVLDRAWLDGNPDHLLPEERDRLIDLWIDAMWRLLAPEPHPALHPRHLLAAQRHPDEATPCDPATS